MTGKKIKVALCLSGEPRNSMFSFPYIYESLVKLGHMYEVDIYIHSWKDFRALPLYNPKKYSIDWVEGGELLKEKFLYLRSLTNHSKTQKLLDQLYEFSFNSTPLKNSFLIFECYHIFFRCKA